MKTEEFKKAEKEIQTILKDANQFVFVGFKDSNVKTVVFSPKRTDVALFIAFLPMFKKILLKEIFTEGIINGQTQSHIVSKIEAREQAEATGV